MALVMSMGAMAFASDDTGNTDPAMALDRALRNEDESSDSVYEDRGLLFI